MIDEMDVTRVHEVTLESDTHEPKTRFFVRSLTRMQRIALAGVIDAMRAVKVKDEQGNYVAEKYAEMIRLAYRAWEMLVINVTCVTSEVPKHRGEFGECVPSSWADKCLADDTQLLELVYAGMAKNIPEDAVKKTPDAASGSPASSPGATAASAGTGANASCADAGSQAPSSTPTSTVEQSTAVPSA